MIIGYMNQSTALMCNDKEKTKNCASLGQTTERLTRHASVRATPDPRCSSCGRTFSFRMVRDNIGYMRAHTG